MPYNIDYEEIYKKIGLPVRCSYDDLEQIDYKFNAHEKFAEIYKKLKEICDEKSILFGRKKYGHDHSPLFKLKIYKAHYEKGYDDRPEYVRLNELQSTGLSLMVGLEIFNIKVDVWSRFRQRWKTDRHLKYYSDREVCSSEHFHYHGGSRKAENYFEDGNALLKLLKSEIEKLSEIKYCKLFSYSAKAQRRESGSFADYTALHMCIKRKPLDGLKSDNRNTGFSHPIRAFQSTKDSRISWENLSDKYFDVKTGSPFLIFPRGEREEEVNISSIPKVKLKNIGEVLLKTSKNQHLNPRVYYQTENDRAYSKPTIEFTNLHINQKSQVDAIPGIDELAITLKRLNTTERDKLNKSGPKLSDILACLSELYAPITIEMPGELQDTKINNNIRSYDNLSAIIEELCKYASLVWCWSSTNKIMLSNTDVPVSTEQPLAILDMTISTEDSISLSFKGLDTIIDRYLRDSYSIKAILPQQVQHFHHDMHTRVKPAVGTLGEIICKIASSIGLVPYVYYLNSNDFNKKIPTLAFKYTPYFMDDSETVNTHHSNLKKMLMPITMDDLEIDSFTNPILITMDMLLMKLQQHYHINIDIHEEILKNEVRVVLEDKTCFFDIISSVCSQLRLDWWWRNDAIVISSHWINYDISSNVALEELANPLINNPDEMYEIKLNLKQGGWRKFLEFYLKRRKYTTNVLFYNKSIYDSNHLNIPELDDDSETSFGDFLLKTAFLNGLEPRLYNQIYIGDDGRSRTKADTLLFIPRMRDSLASNSSELDWKMFANFCKPISYFDNFRDLSVGEHTASSLISLIANTFRVVIYTYENFSFNEIQIMNTRADCNVITLLDEVCIMTGSRWGFINNTTLKIFKNDG